MRRLCSGPPLPLGPWQRSSRPPQGTGALRARGGGRRSLEATGKRSRGLEKLKIETVQDLLQHYPRRHVDRTRAANHRELATMSADQRGPGEVQVLAKRRARLRAPSAQAPERSSSRAGSATRPARSRSPGSTTSGSHGCSSRGPRRSSTASSDSFRGKLQMTMPRFELVRTGQGAVQCRPHHPDLSGHRRPLQRSDPQVDLGDTRTDGRRSWIRCPTIDDDLSG